MDEFHIGIAFVDLLADVSSSRSCSAEDELNRTEVVLLADRMLCKEDEDRGDEWQHPDLVVLYSGAEVIRFEVAEDDAGTAEKKTGYEEAESEDMVEGQEEQDPLLLVVPVIVQRDHVVFSVNPENSRLFLIKIYETFSHLSPYHGHPLLPHLGVKEIKLTIRRC